MDKYIYDDNNGLWYALQGDYYIPCLTIPEEEQQPIGVWGRQHLRYIREYRKGLYDSLLLSGKLNGYLAELNEQAEDQMLWVRWMNSIRDTAKKIVNHDLIYA
jgi:tnpV protein